MILASKAAAPKQSAPCLQSITMQSTANRPAASSLAGCFPRCTLQARSWLMLKSSFTSPHFSVHEVCVQVIPSRDVKVGGLMGPAAPVEKKSPSVADTQTGIGGTTLWKMASLVSYSESRISAKALSLLEAQHHHSGEAVGLVKGAPLREWPQPVQAWHISIQRSP